MTLRWVPGWNGLTEPEAVSYVAAVEAADGQELEFGVAKAINDFVLGCKNDGIWDAIKASCILAGARTLNGALVPLVGTAPTNYNFVAGDYNRETGLVGDGSTKYLDSNRASGSDPLDNNHCAVFPTVVATRTGTPRLIEGQLYTVSGSTGLAESTSAGYVAYNRGNSTSTATPKITQALVGASRSNSFTYQFRRNQSQVQVTQTSQALADPTVTWKLFVAADGIAQRSDARIAFYSIGESLDLAALDTRVSALITAIGAAIP